MLKEDFIKLLEKCSYGVTQGLAITFKNGNKTFVEEGAWEQDIDALVNHIGSFDVEHRTRIVGYMSDMSNWNKSKLGEAKDRKKGNYVI